MTQPVGDKVFIKPEELPERTVAGIILAAKKAKYEGYIIALSEDYDYEEETGVALKVGDYVRYAPNTQEEMEGGNIVISANHIIFVNHNRNYTKDVYDRYKIPYSIIEGDGKQVFDIDLDLIEGEKMDDFHAACRDINEFQKQSGSYDKRKTIGDH
jgi:co-chaperonin GroES (HSP10)